MLLVLTGLHGSGKSHLTKIAEADFNWKIIVQRELLKKLYSEEADGDDWIVWYRRLYEDVGSYGVMNKIIRFIPANNYHTILDSIHNLKEWKVVKRVYPSAVLATVVTPKLVRLARNEPEDEILDIQRINFWHEKAGENTECLLSEAGWTFNGAAPVDLLKMEFRSFLDHFVL